MQLVNMYRGYTRHWRNRSTRKGNRLGRIDESWLRSIPKAEVHVHLEGSFELADILTLAKAAGEPLLGNAATLFEDAALTAVDDATGLGGFLRFLDWQCGLVRSREQAARLAYRFAARQTAAGVRYTDVIVNPSHWSAWRGRELELLDALGAGFEEAEADGLSPVSMCVSLLRQQSPSSAVELTEQLIAHRPSHVVGLSVDGDETLGTPDPARFKDAFTLARDGGLRRTVHAGESSGPESVWAAIEDLHAERIDHGVRSIEDPALVDRLAETGISLGICPSSNVALGIVDSWETHPFLALRDRGVTVTLNTDDPMPLHTTLDHELAEASERFVLSKDDMIQLAANSISASFAPAELQHTLLDTLQSVTTTATAG